MKNIIKSRSGITLIALVVTIIVLLILAGISIGMLSGNNGILKQARSAKTQTNDSTAIEQLKIEILGSFDKNGYLDLDKLKTNMGNIGATVTGESFPVTVTLNGASYTIDGDGNVTKAGPTISVDESTLAITNTDGSSITKGQLEQGTALKINFTASVPNGTVTVSPSLPHTTTTEEIAAKSVTFNITASVPGETVSPRTYTVSLSDVYKSNVVSMTELKANASTYFGYDVINYASTLPSNLQDTKWQLFYAGALDIDSTTATTLGLTEAERTEERIWLISKEYVKNTVLPEKEGATPIPTDGSDYKAQFSTSNYATPNDGVLPKYTSGSSLITQTKLKKLNSDYFKEYSSTNNNMKAVAYMMDTTAWSSFKSDYAEYAIGGPTVELLFTAYNKYKGTAYESDAVSATGYKVRKTSSDSFANSISSAIANDVTTGTNQVDSPYSVSSLTSQANGYWLASPSNNGAGLVMYVRYDGYVDNNNYYGTSRGFRPLVLLNSNFQLEKTKDTNNNDVFQIVPKSE